ncbi:MAG: CPBP family intramembrane metalloprotease [Bacteroidales bacterium]|nr:CPBP family intramembrane metalloprotease [Bacteroidales bacterium]
MRTDTIENYNGQGDSAFLTAPFMGKNAIWRYFIGTIIPFLVSNTIGAIPLIVVMFAYSGAGDLPTKGGMPDFEAIGINLNLGFALTVFPFVLAFFAFILIIRPLNQRSIGSVVNGGRNIRWGRIFLSALVWMAISAVWLIWSLRNDPGNFILSNTSKSLITLAIIAMVMIPFQAGFEELLFRGYLIQGFAVLSRNRWLPAVGSSLLFGLMHALNPEVKEYGFLTMIPQYVFFGLVFAVLTLMDDGTELAIGAHTANNMFLFVFVTHKDSALQTPAMYEQINIYPWQDFAGLVVMSLLFIALMAVVYGWKDVRKLYGRIAVPRRPDAETGSDTKYSG